MRYAAFLCILLYSCNIVAQDTDHYIRTSAITTVVSSGLIGGIGSAIHKKEKETRAGAFLRGFSKGLIGGSFCFTGKYLVGEIQNKNEYGYAWPSKLVHSFGTSIIENAALNKSMLSLFSIDIGFVRMEFENKISFKALPFAGYGVVYMFCQGNKFDYVKSIQTGTPFFTTSEIASYTMYNSIATNPDYNNQKETYRPTWSQHSTFGHEYVHALQYNWLNLSLNSIYIRKMKFIYFDLPVCEVAYSSINFVNKINRDKQYYHNFFEMEAEILGSRSTRELDTVVNF